MLEGDFVWGTVHDIAELPALLIERLQHYFATYKLVAGQEPPLALRAVYGADHAAAVIRAAIADYDGLSAPA